MNITYVLLSPTFGMHQYTADLAGRVADGRLQIADGLPAVRVVTTTTLPRECYAPAVAIDAPVTSRGTGFAREGLDIAAYRRVSAALSRQPPAISHFTGVHAWNVPLVRGLRRSGAPVIHTLHDLDPHTGVRHPALIRLWNRLIIATGCHLLVHGQRTRDQLTARGVPSARVTCTPLLHGFLSAQQPWPPAWQQEGEAGEEDAGNRNTKRNINVLFFGRVEAYKGVEDLLKAWAAPKAAPNGANLIIAGPLARNVTLGELPPGVELRDRRIDDAEADALFRSASLLVLPYRDATQSALIAAAYAYGVPVIVTRTGALPEYVIAGETGWIAPPADSTGLAAVLSEALADRIRLARMGAAGRAWFAAQRRAEEALLAGMYRRLSS